MKRKINIKKICGLLPFLGLALLLLLSPCKVRNFIQAELGIPLTEVANKSKTTISNSTCSIFEIASSTLSKTKYATQLIPEIEGTRFSEELAGFALLDGSSPYHKKRNYAVSHIPFYILYQNRKVYL